MYATIAAALDAASGGDVILIAPGTYGGGFTVAKSVVLSGAGQGSTTIAGQGVEDQSELMTVAGGVKAVFENVTLTGAGRTAIANHGTLEVRDSQLSGNGTFSESSEAGGIVNDGDLTLKRATLYGNLGFAAGAVLSDGMARILDSTISENAAVFEAGGIFSRGDGELVLRNSTVTGNVSQGAAVLGGGTSTVIEGTTVSGNAGDLAGGIYGGNLVIRDSLVEGNHGSFGGAGGIAATFGHTQVVRSTIRDNDISTSTRGGGIRNDAGSSMMVINTVVVGNRAPLPGDGQGGGIWNGGTLRVVASAITGNAAGTPDEPGVGGGIYNVGRIVLAATLIADNFPDDCFGCPTG
jgi:hypothetical protein